MLYLVTVLPAIYKIRFSFTFLSRTHFNVTVKQHSPVVGLDERYPWSAYFYSSSSVFRVERIVLYGRTDGGYLLFTDIQQLRQEEVRATVAQLSRTVSAQPDVLLRHTAILHTVRPPGAHIHHATVQPPGVDQDGPNQCRGRRSEARRTEGTRPYGTTHSRITLNYFTNLKSTELNN